MFVIPDECRGDLPLDRSLDLLDGIEIQGIWWKMHGTNIVASGMLPDENRMMEVEVVENDDEPFAGIRSLIFSQHP